MKIEIKKKKRLRMIKMYLEMKCNNDTTEIE